MPRVEIDFPEPALFRTELPIRIGDLNYGGHLGNDAVLALAQEARVRFLAAHGFPTELEVGGAGLVMTHAAVMYRAEGKYGMVLGIELAATEVRTRSFELAYRMTDLASRAEIARVATGLLCYDYAAKRIVSLPEPLRRALAPAR